MSALNRNFDLIGFATDLLELFKKDRPRAQHPHTEVVITLIKMQLVNSKMYESGFYRPKCTIVGIEGPVIAECVGVGVMYTMTTNRK
jgi:hypothetical protein